MCVRYIFLRKRRKRYELQLHVYYMGHKKPDTISGMGGGEDNSESVFLHLFLILNVLPRSHRHYHRRMYPRRKEKGNARREPRR